MTAFAPNVSPIQFEILSRLDEKSGLTGRDFVRSTAPVVKLSSVYVILSRMEDLDWIYSREGEVANWRRQYFLTKLGKRVLLAAEAANLLWQTLQD